MNKINIVNSPGKMANKLHLYASIYAYCLEKGYECLNYDFKKFYKYYNIPPPIFNLKAELIRIEMKVINKIKFLFFLQNIFFPKRIINGSQEFFLPPDINNNAKQIQILKLIDKNNNRNYYFNGWLFRSHTGIEKYHKEIVQYFKPQKKYTQIVNDFLDKIRNQYKFVVGVHIRRGDYRQWRGGVYFYEFFEVNVILCDLLKNLPFNKNEVVFIICSDESIDKDAFGGLNFISGLGTEITDLYTLAECDLIVGSNSTFNAWAADYGRRPRILFSL